MIAPSIPPIRPGDPITASWLGKVRAAAVQMLGLRAEAPLELIRTAGGPILRLAWNPRIWVRIDSGTQPYAWRDLQPTASGGWAIGLRSGTALVDPAYEQNGNKAVPAGIVVLARRAWGSGALVFQLGTCSTNQPSPTVTPGSTQVPTTGATTTPPSRALPVPSSYSGFPSDGRPVPFSALTGGGP